MLLDEGPELQLPAEAEGGRSRGRRRGARRTGGRGGGPVDARVGLGGGPACWPDERDSGGVGWRWLGYVDAASDFSDLLT
jgi:hypothetical protein